MTTNINNDTNATSDYRVLEAHELDHVTGGFCPVGMFGRFIGRTVKNVVVSWANDLADAVTGALNAARKAFLSWF